MTDKVKRNYTRSDDKQLQDTIDRFGEQGRAVEEENPGRTNRTEERQAPTT